MRTRIFEIFEIRIALISRVFEEKIKITWLLPSSMSSASVFSDVCLVITIKIEANS